MHRILPLFLTALLVPLPAAVGQGAWKSPYAAWRNGPPKAQSWFPLAVWLQSPTRVARWKKAGINLFIGLWKGPTEEQLAALAAARMPVICHQNRVGLTSRHRRWIVGWLQVDEPDNARSLGRGKGYGPPITPKVIVERRQTLIRRDPTRPVLLNLGQGVAWDGWRGRGVRTNHPEDYPRYVKGGDIVSFDIYPACHRSPQVAGRLEFVARGVKRLKGWAGKGRPVWNCLEASRIHNPKVKATPRQLEAQAWMAIIHGSRGLIWFVHQFKPRFNEAALLDDKVLLPAVTRINGRITDLAGVINAPEAKGLFKVTTDNKGIPVDFTVRRVGKVVHLFAVSMRPGTVRARFTCRRTLAAGGVELLRSSALPPPPAGAPAPSGITRKGNTLQIPFTDHQVRLLKVRLK